MGPWFESRSRSQIQEPSLTAGFFIACRLSPGTTSQAIRFVRPSGAALKRVQLRCRVQVAEPNSRTQPNRWVFFACRLSPGTTSQVIRFVCPSGAALKRVQLRCRVQIAEPNSKASADLVLLKALILQLQEQVALLRHKLFSPKSERSPEDTDSPQLAMFNEAEELIEGKRSINPVLADGVVFRKQLALASSSTATALRSLRRC